MSVQTSRRAVAAIVDDVVAATYVAASYERVSTFRQAQQGFSLKAQDKDATQFAAEQGWRLPEHLRFRDGESENASGTDWDLPGLNAMLDAAKRGEFQVLIVPDLDRFARTMVKGLVIEEQLRKYGVRLIFIRVPLEDSPEGRLLKNQLYGFAEYEREKITLRTSRGRREKAEQGMVVGQGDAPYGLRFVREQVGRVVKVVGLEADPLTAPIAVRIFDLSRTNSSNQVATILNDEGVPSPAGKRWRENTIQRILTNPAYIGTMIYGAKSYFKARAVERGENVVEIPVPPIVDQATWDAVHEARTRRLSVRRGRVPPEQDPYLLRGRVTCGLCTRVLVCDATKGANRKETRYYVCHQSEPKTVRLLGWDHVCELPYVNAAALEAYLWDDLRAALLDRERLAQGVAASRAQHDAADSHQRDRITIIDREIKSHRANLEKYADKLVDAPRGSEREDYYERKVAEAEEMIRKYKAERKTLEATKLVGLSEEDAASLEAFAETVREGFTDFTTADIRKAFEWLQIRVTIREDPNGVKLGKVHRYRVDWEGCVSLTSSGHGILKRCLLRGTSASPAVGVYAAATA